MTGPQGLSGVLDRLIDGDSSLHWRDLDAPSADADEDEALRTLLLIYQLWMAPLSVTRGREVFQTHPAVCSLKGRLEEQLIGRLDARREVLDAHIDVDQDPEPAGGGVDRFRRTAAHDLVPSIYTWVSEDATWDQLVEFLAHEGGPDAEFDDLVALTQVGIVGEPKLTLAANYWDEMGRGVRSAVHTELHHRMVQAIALRHVPVDELGAGGLERKVIGGLLATNRWLQPEALGAFGLLEMQAGPRCRAVVRAMKRLDAPAAALPFYEEHAHADPRHGKDWFDHVVVPLVEDPRWSAGMVRGARWRQAVNARFFAEMEERFGLSGSHAS